MKTIFVGGVHGVGKSTCCKEAAATCQWLHASASDLIRKQRADAVATVGKGVADVEGNQQLLLRGVNELRAASNRTPIVLDGHFALFGEDMTVQRLPISVFAALHLDGLVCFADEPAAIASRLCERDGQGVSVREVAALQQEELAHAKDVATALGIPLDVFPAFNTARLSRLLAMAM
jgi:adenylate kinase